MRETVIDGKTIRMNERDYKQLLRHLDPSRAKLKNGAWFISTECICPNGFCPRCPLGGDDESACFELLDTLGLSNDCISLNYSSTIWKNKVDVEARRQLSAIHNYLLSIPRTEHYPEEER